MAVGCVDAQREMVRAVRCREAVVAIAATNRLERRQPRRSRCLLAWKDSMLSTCHAQKGCTMLGEDGESYNAPWQQESRKGRENKSESFAEI
jgi:hypothetical protein